MNPKDFTLHSGGANGSDFQFEIIGREFGVINFIHYWYGKMNPHSLPEHEITVEDYLDGVEMVHKANTILKRQGYEKYMNLLARNWSQCKYSDAVYAIGTLKNNKIVNGGTGWCVAFAQLTDKELYVFDQDKEQWYFWNGKFEVCVTPRLTKDFAGIGTRKINESGILAIRNVYKRTFTS
jgi:hypothetical protein